MRIIAVNGSPKGSAGNTDILLQAFLAGAREAGAETETVYLKEKEIRHCVDCRNRRVDLFICYSFISA